MEKDDKWYNSFTNWFSDIGDSLGQGLSSLKDGFTSGLSGIFDKLGNVVNFLGDILNNIIDIPKKIIELLGNLLEYLFVPQFNPVEEVKNKIEEKFTFITQMVSLSSDLFKDFDSNSAPPVFSITYKGVECPIINFEIYKPYRATVQSIIIAIAWINFVLWLFNFAPKIIKGGG